MGKEHGSFTGIGLDAMCAEFQLIEIGNLLTPWGPSSIAQQTDQC